MAARFRWDDFVLDLDAYRLERDGAPLALEPKAFNLLALMVQRPGHLFTKQELFDAIWPDTAVTDHALTRVIAQVRRVLGDEAREAIYLETVPTRGYRWIRPVAEAPVSPRTVPAVPAPVPVPPTEIAAAARRWPASAIVAGLVAGVVVLALAWVPARRAWFSPLPARAAVDGVPTSAASGPGWPRQITTHGGLDFQPALSPQGDALAFASDRNGRLEIYVRTLDDAGSETMVTSDGAHNVEPSWSPDGRWLAYHSGRNGGIWVVPARGGVPRQVVAVGSKPAWSPDSRRIAYQSDEHADVAPTGFGAQSGSTIWIVDMDGGNAHAVTTSGAPPGGHSLPAWHPGGRHLAFSVFDGGFNNGIWRVDLETGAPTLVHRGAGLFDSAFAPDGSSLFVAGGDALLFRIPLDPAGGASGTPEVIPVAGVPGVRGLSLSADGRHLAFGGVALSSQIWAQPIARDGSAAGPPRELTSDTSRRNAVPTVSPDGAKVAYTSSRRGEPPNVWVMDVDGRNALQLSPNESFDWQPAWFPDSRRVAYVSNQDGVPGLWSVDIATRRQERIIDASLLRGMFTDAAQHGRVAELQLSPSMTQVALGVLTPRSGTRRIFVSALAPLAPRPLTDGLQSIGYPAWSPDETRLAVEIKDGSSTHAGIVDVATGAVRRLTSARGQTWVRSWSPDGSRIAVAALRDGAWSLRWIDVESGREGAIAPPEPPRIYVRYPSWSRRGDLVVYERAEMRGNIWRLALQH